MDCARQKVPAAIQSQVIKWLLPELTGELIQLHSLGGATAMHNSMAAGNKLGHFENVLAGVSAPNLVPVGNLKKPTGGKRKCQAPACLYMSTDMI